jgi:hypothetical protein
VDDCERFGSTKESSRKGECRRAWRCMPSVGVRLNRSIEDQFVLPTVALQLKLPGLSTLTLEALNLERSASTDIQCTGQGLWLQFKFKSASRDQAFVY